MSKYVLCTLKDYNKDIANSIFNSLGASLIGWFSFCGTALSTFIQWHLKNIKRPFVRLSSIVHDVVYLSVQVCLRIRANSSTTIRMDRKKRRKTRSFVFYLCYSGFRAYLFPKANKGAVVQRNCKKSISCFNEKSALRVTPHFSNLSHDF